MLRPLGVVFGDADHVRREWWPSRTEKNGWLVPTMCKPRSPSRGEEVRQVSPQRGHGDHGGEGREGCLEEYEIVLETTRKKEVEVMGFPMSRSWKTLGNKRR